MSVKGFLFLTFFCIYVSAVELPSYIKICHKKDPNLSQCFINSANEALPKIVEGNREFGQVPLNPFVIPKVELKGGNNIVLTFYQLKAYGLGNALLLHDGAKIDIEKGEVICKATVPLITFDGDYEINGQILVLPINGKGRGILKYHEPTLFLTAKFDFEDKDGKKFLKFRDSTVNYDVKKVEYHFENLFNGDEKLGNEMNKVLNENWQAVDGDLHDAGVAAVKATVDLLLTNYFTKLPLDTIFPD